MPGLKDAWNLERESTVIDLDRVEWHRLRHIHAIKYPKIGDALLWVTWICVDPRPSGDRWFFCGHFEADVNKVWPRCYFTPCSDYVQAIEIEAARLFLKDGWNAADLPPAIEAAARAEATGRPESAAERRKRLNQEKYRHAYKLNEAMGEAKAILRMADELGKPVIRSTFRDWVEKGG